MASNAYPPLKALQPPTFLKAVSVGEVVIGGLLTMYARTPALREPGSIWPSQQGIAVAKDVWMLGIGLGLLLEPSDPGSPPTL
jgi:hypothetical protein